ncbi:hypothetical protein ACU6U9_01250 [Pseudomonas sp. HK3]
MLYTAAQLTYLEHLGIDVWVPKDMQIDVAAVEVSQAPQPQLETAKVAVNVNDTTAYVAPSHFEDVPAARTATTGTPHFAPEHAAPVQSPQASSLGQAQVNKPAAASALSSALTSSIPAPAFPAPPVTQVADAVARVEFNIQFWCYSSGVWLISGDVNITPEQHKLVHNLAQFMQGKKRRPRHVNVFSWPMIDSPNVDQGEDIASKYLLAHIDRLQQACEKNVVIVFNDCDYFPTQTPHIKLDVSLQQLLHEPMAKKALWQQLIPHKLDY